MADDSINKAFTGKKRDKDAGISEKVIGILNILNLIEQGKYPNVPELAKECEVTERTIHRYLNIIKFIVPIVYDRIKGGYRFENKDSSKLKSFTNEEIAAIAAISHITKSLGDPVNSYFQSVLDKINSHAKPDVKQSNVIKVMIPKTKITFSAVWFENIIKAIIEQKQLEIKYHAINTDEVTTRIIDPYEVYFDDGIWFVYAYCHKRNERRSFAFDRLKSVKLINTKFDKPDNWNIDTNRAWHVREGTDTTVKVIFAKEVAELIKRKTSWHPSETRTVKVTGEVELTFRLSGTEEIKWWINSWIPYVTVLEPESLRLEIKRDLEKAMLAYE
ncbi:MAG: WYL domain-containing protein [Nitrospirae bacterium]|nr:WYL domain-containing protein [Nitrospirota bacterium]